MIDEEFRCDEHEIVPFILSGKSIFTRFFLYSFRISILYITITRRKRWYIGYINI